MFFKLGFRASQLVLIGGIKSSSGSFCRLLVNSTCWDLWREPAFLQITTAVVPPESIASLASLRAVQQSIGFVQHGRRYSTMAEAGKHDDEQEQVRYPAVDTYGPITIRGSYLEPGKKKKWCTCGLSKKAPWCDGAHKRTGFKSLKWIVPENPQSYYEICNCKHTKTPPFCDGTHTNLPEIVMKRQENCPNKPNHPECEKMCTGCGWKKVVDF